MRTLLAFVLAFTIVTSCAKDDYARLYATAPKAPSIDAVDVEALRVLGPTLIDRGVNFGVFSERATRVELLLFDDPEADRPTRQFPMERFGDVWNLYVEGVGLGQHYGYVAWGPNWTYDEKWFPGQITGFVADVDAQGNRFNPNKLLADPYAKAVHRDHDWSKGSVASGPKRTEVTYGASSKSVVVTSTYAWSDAENKWREAREDPNWKGHGWQDLILYEVHPKGFTASAASGVQHPGTYRGVAEKADYLKDLGITAVEFLPVHEKPLDGGYWGYQTLNFFAPEISYCAKAKAEGQGGMPRISTGECLDEFKFMVEELHKRGIEVILDVVYNHTGEGGLWREKIEIDPSPDVQLDAQLKNFDPFEVAGLYSFRGLDNASYYALDSGGKTYWNNTGVGNQTRPNHRPMRRMILDSLRFYADELHVDGFRFDLAPILGEKDLAFNEWDEPKNTVLQEIIDDPALQKHNTRIIAEPWSAGGRYTEPIARCPGNTVCLSAFPNSTKLAGDGWYEWNGAFRDWWRSFIADDAWKLNYEEWKLKPANEDFGFFTYGSKDYYQPSGRRPYHSVNFVTIHDGFTMYDLVSYETKVNKCGPLNPVCCDQPFSAFCDRDSGENNNKSRNWGDEGLKRQMMRNFFAAMMVSHGTPMILGGDEWMRTQLGNNNAYSTRADNEFNWFDWGAWEPNADRRRMHDFVARLIRFRKEHAYAFAPSDYGQGAPFSWKSAQNTEPPDWGGRAIMLHYYDKSRGPELAVLINMWDGGVTFTLPANRSWKAIFDTDLQHETANFFQPPLQKSGSYDLGRRAIAVLEAQ